MKFATVAATRTSRHFVTSVLSVVALLCCGHGLAKGGKPQPPVARPISYVTATSRFQIAVVDVGGTSSAIVNSSTSDSYPRWSPDGLLIGGYYSSGSDTSIMTMNSGGVGERAFLTAAQFHAWNLARPGVQASAGFDFFSSNCWLGTNAILFTATTTYDASFFGQQGAPITASRLFIANASGTISPLTELAPHAGTYDLDPHWSQALGKVVFITPTSSLKPELFAINANGSGLQQITNFGGSADHLHWPVWSPAGDRLLVAVHPVGGNWQLWILDVNLAAAGGAVTAVHPFKVVDGGGGYPQTGAWSPDGTQIVLSRTVYDDHNRRFFELVIADAASGAETLIKRTSSNIEFPDWKPVQ